MTTPSIKYIFVIAIALFQNVFAQTNTVNIEFNSGSCQLNQTLFLNNEDSVEINRFKFYISNLSFFNNKQLVFEEEASAHLIDLGNFESLSFQIEIPSNLVYNKIAFTLGIDSSKNHEGVFGGDLDPTLGMYWTWQSGYINFKMEGTRLNNNEDFEFHLGGFLNGFKCEQEINCDLQTTKNITLGFDCNSFLKAIDLEAQQRIMSPCEKAVELMELAKQQLYLLEDVK